MAALAFALAGCAAPDGAAPDEAARRQHAVQAVAARLRADAWYERADWGAAAAAYLELIDHAPGQVHAWLRLGNCRMRLGQPSEAAAAFERALALAPDEGRAGYNLALVRLAQAEAALRHARAPGRRLGAQAAEAQRLHALLRWLVEGDDREDGASVPGAGAASPPGPWAGTGRPAVAQGSP